MASIQQRSKGSFLIQFYDSHGNRRGVSLSGTTKKNATIVAGHIEHLASAVKTGHALPGPTAAWVAEQSPFITKKLVRVGLIAPRRSYTLGEWLDEYFKGRKDWADRTRSKNETSRKHLEDYLKKEKLLSDITAGDADEFARHLPTVDGINSAATIHKHIQNARTYFRAAMRKRLIEENPFDGIKTQANVGDVHFVTPEETAKVFEACSSIQWRLVFALARYGGLRMPSELNDLQWGDILWDQNKILIRSPKTARYGKAERFVPIFKELRPYLDEAESIAQGGDVYVVSVTRKKKVLNAAYLRKRMRIIIERAGVVPWPKLFQSMRSTRQTELEAEYPTHVVCGWLGNSPRIAHRHYLKTTQADFDTAATGKAVENDREKLMLDLMRQIAEMSGISEQGSLGDISQTEIQQQLAAICSDSPSVKVGQAGLIENVANTLLQLVLRQRNAPA